MVAPAGRAIPPADPVAAAAAAAAAAVAAVAAPPAPGEDQLVVPPSDKRAYKRLTLPNDMTVLLISDPSMAEEAAAGMPDDDGCGEEGPHARGGGRARNPAAARSSSSDDDGADGESGSESGSDSGGSSGSSDDDDAEVDAELAGPPDDEGGGGHGSHHGHRHHPPRAPTKKAAAAMAVAAGSLADPPSLPGLAHYLEHMLFMGSVKFPDENGYDAFLSRAGGSSNAYTDFEDTVYYFDCRPGALAGALDRFAQFFVAPLMKADALGREVSAVDNEFSGVLQSDGCRLAQLRAHTASAGHPFARFAWGNRASLADGPAAAGLDVRGAMLDFYTREYGAERMTLVVLGGQPLEEMARLVGTAFGPVPAGVGPPTDHGRAGPPYGGGTLHISPAVKEGHTLTLAWCLPPLGHKYRSKAEDYLAHLLGHEGAGSLLAGLKARGWATGLSAGVGEGGAERSSAAFVFEVAIALTDAGLAAGPGAGLAPAGLVFAYIGLLARSGPQAWVHAEVSAIAAARFRFAEEEDAAEFVARLAPECRRYAPHHALAGPYLHDEWDPELVSALTAGLTPGAARLDLQTSAAAGVLPPPTPPKGGAGAGGAG
jgi:nardilysin